MVNLNIDEADCKVAADFIEMYFFKNIRDDPDIDNIEYVRSLLRTFDELNRVAHDTEKG